MDFTYTFASTIVSVSLTPDNPFILRTVAVKASIVGASNSTTTSHLPKTGKAVLTPLKPLILSATAKREVTSRILPASQRMRTHAEINYCTPLHLVSVSYINSCAIGASHRLLSVENQAYYEHNCGIYGQADQIVRHAC